MHKVPQGERRATCLFEKMKTKMYIGSLLMGLGITFLLVSMIIFVSVSSFFILDEGSPARAATNGYALVTGACGIVVLLLGYKVIKNAKKNRLW